MPYSSKPYGSMSIMCQKLRLVCALGTNESIYFDVYFIHISNSKFRNVKNFFLYKYFHELNLFYFCFFYLVAPYRLILLLFQKAVSENWTYCEL